MISKMTACLAPILALVATTGAPAKGPMVEANGARAQQRWGGELGLGYTLGLGNFRLRPIAGIFIHRGDDDRYDTERFSNGQTRCRDTSTGRFAKDSDCVNVDVKPYGKVEATFAIPAGPEIGGGARFSADRVRPYGTIAFGTGSLRLKGNAGDRYFALGAAFQF